MTQAVIEEIRKQRIKLYYTLSLPLDNARSDFELGFSGNYIFVLGLTGSAQLKLNENFSDSIDMVKSRSIQAPFYRLYLSNTAQPGLILLLAIGVNQDYFKISDFQAPDLSIMAGYMQNLRDSLAYGFGSQIVKSNSASGGATVLMYQVTSGKNFLLEHYSVSTNNVSFPNNLFVTDDVDTLQYNIVNDVINASRSSPCLILIPQNWKIKILAVGASCQINAFIKGREI